MYEIILFGGTSEGRELAGLLNEKNISALVCTATEYGGELVNITSPLVKLSTRRLCLAEIRALLTKETPRLVLDATHPYAADVTKNLRTACEETKTKYLRVLRQSLPAAGCTIAEDMNELVALLNTREGIIFSALGAKAAASLTGVSDYKSRVFLRILPQPEALSTCLALGYPAGHIVCMQGPFSQSLNRAMLESSGAFILVTKESGSDGGFEEKLNAARELGLEIIVLRRPKELGGLTLAEAKAIIGEHRK